MNTDPSNEDRAEWAQMACDKFAEVTKMDATGGNEELVTIMGDLVADLMHLASQQNINWDQLVAAAKICYEEEVAEADGDCDRFVIETRTIGDWERLDHTDDLVTVYSSRQEARDELEDMFVDMASAGIDFNRSDWRVVPE